MVRRAVIHHKADIETVRAYLPANYTANHDSYLDCIVIEGRDNAGWTLDGYVIPRLGSGWIHATEVS